MASSDLASKSIGVGFVVVEETPAESSVVYLPRELMAQNMNTSQISQSEQSVLTLQRLKTVAII